MDFCKIMEQQSILTKKEFCYFFTKIKDGPSVYAWSPSSLRRRICPPPGVPPELVLLSTFIELPKFTPHSISDKRMMVLWLRFLTEINANTQEIPSDLLRDPEIGKAVEELKISGFTDAELRAYDKFWDSVSVERTLLDDRYQKGKEEGIAEGMEKGRAEGMEKGMSQRSLEIARKMLAKGLDDTTIIEMTGLSLDEIRLLKSQMNKI